MWNSSFAKSIKQMKIVFRRMSTISTGRKLYELRKYAIKPKNTLQFINLVNEVIHVRTAHSKLIGFWMSEMGELNQTYHLWEYDNYEHRTKVRKAVAEDRTWQEKCLQPMYKLIQHQTNCSLKLINDQELNLQTQSKSGVYELQLYQFQKLMSLKDDNLVQIIEIFKNIYLKLNSCLIGAFIQDFGVENEVFFLWFHHSFEQASLAKEKVKGNFELKDLSFWNDVKLARSIALKPIEISPLK